MTIPESIKKEITGWFQVVFDWETISKGLFRSDKTIYHAADSDAIPMRFWMNTQYVIRKVFGYRASFITMIYKEFHHDCILHVESSIIQGRKSNVEVIPLGGENSPTKTILIKIGVARHVVFDDSRIYELKRGRMSSEMRLVDLVSAGYDNAELHDDDLPKEVSTTIGDLSRMLEEGLNCSFGSIKTIYKTMHDIALMIVSYAYPSMTFRSKNFSLFNQKCYGSDALNYSSSGAFVLWKRPVIERLDQNLEYQLWLKDIRLDSYDKTISDMRRIAKVQATHTAVGSIMSRNGSHNIGSHVLAALSHNVGTMPDDRVLYQYIQHRMDYIATVTTEAPSWAASTKFIGEMMRTFLSQRHLLEYIASSEGLKAYRFQDPNIDSASQRQTIQIHVRYGKSEKDFDALDETGNKGPSDLFFGTKDELLDHTKDVSLAIPGGVVGQHAFFTIIENVIRNAAKHGWSCRSESERSESNLEVYIDVLDDVGKNYVTFRIWDNMSNVKTNQELSALRGNKFEVPETTECLSSELVAKLLARYAEETESGFKGERLLDGDKIPLHWRQQILMDQRIIQANGSLRRENWGMAEMKISAGYLQRRSIGQIGGLDKLDDPDDYIVRAITICEGDVYHLGYEFRVPRPKKILIVLKGDNLPSNETEFNKNGIYFLPANKAAESICEWDGGKKTDAFAAEYLVIESASALFGNDQETLLKKFGNVPFPFRVLSCEKLQGKLSKMIPRVNLPEEALFTAANVIDAVLSSWRGYCCSRRNEADKNNDGKNKVGKKFGLFVNTKGTSGAGQALISNTDIWRLLFTEYFHSTLASFSFDYGEEDRYLKDFIDVLLADRKKYAFFCDEDWDAVRGSALSNCFWQSVGGELSDKQAQIRKFIALDGQSVVAWQLKYLLAVYYDFKDEHKERLGRELDAITGAATENLVEQLKAVYNSYFYTPRPGLRRLIQHFKLAFDHLDVMLRKYEERIVTLPKAYAALNAQTQGDARDVGDEGESTPAEAVVTYDRHREVTEDDCARHVYVEPLSGSQSYLNSLVDFQQHWIDVKRDVLKLKEAEDKFIHARLMENGLMRVLFVDERISRFLRNHEKSRWIYRAMNMWCVDETKNAGQGGCPENSKGELLHFSADKGKNLVDAFVSVLKKWKTDTFKFDALIIHQGIIDKWCENSSSVAQMNGVIDKLKSVIDYVVITTGRGTPANIPSCARILPFSTIESTLFKLYPEKLTLIDSIMNILPLGGNRNGNAT